MSKKNIGSILLNELDSITAILIRKNYSVQQNKIILKNNEILWSGNTDISIALKNVNYSLIYSELDSNGAYFMKLLDGALVQIFYKVSNNEILKARLAYFPSPQLKRYEDDIMGYKNEAYSDGIYKDIIAEHIVTFPIRIDFDPDPQSYKEKDHTKVHLHLGQIENCRIPVARVLMPKDFFSFILKNFYNDLYKEIGEDFFKSKIKNNILLTEAEKNILHLNY